VSAEIEWSDPPTSSRDNRNWPQIAAALRLRPNEWAIVEKPATAYQAGQLAANIRRGKVGGVRPDEDFDAMSRKVDGEYRVYARYVGGGGS